MAAPHFRPGELYAAKSHVRAHYREYWKGILVRDGRVAIIVSVQRTPFVTATVTPWQRA